MGWVNISYLIKEIDISTREALAYAMYFDYKLMHGLSRKWDHYTVRAFILSISRIRKGYYSVLRKVKDEVLFRDISELEKFEWLKGWIFYKDEQGRWWIVVDGETDRFEKFREEYKRLVGER